MLRVKQLSKFFNGFAAVKEVSFQANGGEIFGLLGPNGAGKTTTIRVIATVLTPTSGTAEVASFDILKAPEKVRQNLGLLTSEIGLYDRFTARENLRYFGNLYGLAGQALEDRIDYLVEILDMQKFADRRAGKFSTGMKQKVAIARSIIHDPKVIIFDEPTAGLDVLASQTVIDYMQTARKEGKLVVLSTHDMAHAQKLCDRVAIMHQGKIIAVDSQAKIYQQTQADNLEDAFLKILGADAAKSALKAKEAFELRWLSKKHKRFGL
ncbi:ATP-binding cassette domain-containing protein [Candidatus Parcubacteria bacterium]|jgi:sodium transport system ATP-binding protein|nr:MAG: ATP-binding cassette domain-containing protein [Candidatus Parcubacteria bacterium]